MINEIMAIVRQLEAAADAGVGTAITAQDVRVLVESLMQQQDVNFLLGVAIVKMGGSMDVTEADVTKLPEHGFVMQREDVGDEGVVRISMIEVDGHARH